MSERAAKNDGEEGDDHAEGADDAPPPSIEGLFPRRAPPTAEELRRFKLKFPKIVETYTRLVHFKLKALGVGNDDREPLCAEAFTRLYAMAKRWGVPTNVPVSLSSIAWRTGSTFVRDEGRKAGRTRAFQREPAELRTGVDPSAFYRLLLLEAGAQLSTTHADLLRWHHVEGDTCVEIAERLGLPENTVYTRLRAARARLKEIVEPESQKDPRP